MIVVERLLCSMRVLQMGTMAKNPGGWLLKQGVVAREINRLPSASWNSDVERERGITILAKKQSCKCGMISALSV
jgi:hypothetical protein